MSTDTEVKIVAEGMLSYPALYEPRAGKTIDKATGKPMLKYQATIVITDDAVLKRLKQAYVAAVVEKFGKDKGEEMLRKKMLKSPFLDNGVKWDYPEGSTYIRVSSKKRPGVVADFRDPSTGKPAKITDPERMYPGVQIRATLRLFWYEAEGNKGFSFGLNNVQRLTRKDDSGKVSKEDWPRLDNRTNAEDDFDADDSIDADDMPEFGDGDSGSVTGDVSDLV